MSKTTQQRATAIVTVAATPVAAPVATHIPAQQRLPKGVEFPKQELLCYFEDL